MINAVAHIKGGTGKTTTAAHLLSALAEREEPLAGIDAETQGSLVGWAAAAGERFPTVEVAASPRGLGELVARYRQPYDRVVIDTPNDPARSQAMVAGALAVSDLVLVPVAPTPLEFLRLSPTAALIAQARDQQPSLRAAVLLSRVRAVTRSAHEARQTLVGAGWEVLAAEVHLRESIAQSVGDARPHDANGDVAAEVLALRPATTGT